MAELTDDKLRKIRDRLLKEAKHTEDPQYKHKYIDGVLDMFNSSLMELQNEEAPVETTKKD